MSSESPIAITRAPACAAACTTRTPDAADAVDHRRVAQPQVRQLRGVHRRHAGAGQDRRGRQVHAVGHGHGVLLGHDDVLGVASVAIEPELLGLVVADVRAALEALLAAAAEDLVVDRDLGPVRQRHALAHALDDAGGLVPEGHRVRVGFDHAVEDVEIGSAHAGRVDPDEHLTGARLAGRRSRPHAATGLRGSAPHASTFLLLRRVEPAAVSPYAMSQNSASYRIDRSKISESADIRRSSEGSTSRSSRAVVWATSPS